MSIFGITIDPIIIASVVVLSGISLLLVFFISLAEKKLLPDGDVRILINDDFSNDDFDDDFTSRCHPSTCL